MFPYFAEEFGNPHSSDHVVGWRAAGALEEATDRIAHLIGADSDEIFFTSGATESNNLALLGLGRRSISGNRHRILVSSIEHKCVLAVSRILREHLGYTVEQLPVDTEGRLIIRDLEKAMDENVLIVSVMAVNNEIGTIQDIQSISTVVRKHGAMFHSDAAQAPGAIDLGTIARTVDFLSLSGHKMCGPKGIGALFVRRDLQDQIEPLIYGGGQQRNLRSGTVPVALCVGMGAAAAILGRGPAIRDRESLRHRRDRFVDSLLRLPWRVVVNGPRSAERHPGNANVRFDGFSAHEILGALQPRVAASTGSACTSGIPEPSHVLKAIGLTSSESEASIRFSLGIQTSDNDIDRATSLIREVLASLSGGHV